MLQVKTPAFVLDKQPGYNDEGKILLFTKHFGIMRVVASGVYKSGASLAAWTEPPCYVIANIAIREECFEYGRLLTLTPRNFFSEIRSDYQNLSWYYFYCFLLGIFLPYGVKSENVYKLLRGVLDFQKTWENSEKRDLNFIYFLVWLLKIEGICSGFDYCLKCEKQFKEEETAYFILSEQGLLCEGCSKKKLLWQNNFSLDFLNLLPQEKKLNLPNGLLRIKPEERAVLSMCEKSRKISQAYTNIFSHPKINKHLFAKVRNFLLIFLAPLL